MDNHRRQRLDDDGSFCFTTSSRAPAPVLPDDGWADSVPRRAAPVPIRPPRVAELLATQNDDRLEQACADGDVALEDLEEEFDAQLETPASRADPDEAARAMSAFNARYQLRHGAPPRLAPPVPRPEPSRANTDPVAPSSGQLGAPTPSSHTATGPDQADAPAMTAEELDQPPPVAHMLEREILERELVSPDVPCADVIATVLAQPRILLTEPPARTASRQAARTFEAHAAAYRGYAPMSEADWSRELGRWSDEQSTAVCGADYLAVTLRLDDAFFGVCLLRRSPGAHSALLAFAGFLFCQSWRSHSLDLIERRQE